MNYRKTLSTIVVAQAATVWSHHPEQECHEVRAIKFFEVLPIDLQCFGRLTFDRKGRSKARTDRWRAERVEIFCYILAKKLENIFQCNWQESEQSHLAWKVEICSF